MPRNLVLTIRLHDGRYHGTREWPPSPARLFQGLMAGAAHGAVIDGESTRALEWLDGLRPPTIGSPTMRIGQRVETFVPDNDMDAVGGNPERAGDVRSSKVTQPKLFDPEVPFLYVWKVQDGEDGARHANKICALAELLYQFGRGVDMAWAWGEVLDDDALDARLLNYSGRVYRPSGGGNGTTLACPAPGSLVSLTERYVANSHRFKTEGQSKPPRQLFSQPPKPRFVEVAYDSLPSRRVYELRDTTTEASFVVWPLAQVSMLVVCLRDEAVDRLRRSLPDRISEIERVLVGRKADGTDDGLTSARVRIVPLPSIGHHYADCGIRRVLIEVPAGCPLRADDVHWAFSGLDFTDSETGEMRLVLTPSSDEAMLAHYGATDPTGSRVWRTVTPAALPEAAKRRRIDPERVVAEAKGGAERAAELARAETAVIQSLRHADMRTQVEAVRLQREPFEANGERVEAFAPGTRFAKERLWHTEITFSAPIAGPLVIGDGRFLGLGVMAPVQRGMAVHAFAVESGLDATAQPTDVTRALRRAVMARVQDVLGARTTLPTFFTGHEDDGSAAQTELHSHLTFVFDPKRARLLVVAPHVVDRRAPTREETRYLESLETALADFRELRAGSAGRLILRASAVIAADADPLFKASRSWESVTPYQVTRHTKLVGVSEALSVDLRAECRRRGLPAPRVTLLESRGVSGVGLVGTARLTFEVAVEGPIVIGRSRHFGGGLFAGTA